MKQSVFIILLFLYFDCFSQSFSGFVEYKFDNYRISNANIIVHNIKDSSVISFSKSDDNGHFKIHYRGVLPLLISASALGYAKEFITIKDSSNLQSPIVFKLIKEDKILEEVIVTSTPKIKVSGDTTSYNLSSFTTGNERALEDALAKLPGFSVGTDGRISVNGRSIQKILIEGDDLVNKNYTLLSKNMSPEMISSIQVFDKYIDDHMMRNVEKSDDIAINLTFKKEFKKLFFGDATLEGGPDKRYNVVVNSMLLSARHKAYVLVNGNNIGKQPSFVGNREVTPQTTLAKEYNPLLESRELSSINPGKVPLVENRRSFFNKTSVASLNLLNKITEKLNLKTNISIFSDDNKLGKRLQTTYFTGSEIVSFSENNNWRAKPLQMESSFEAQYIFSQKSRIKYNFAGSYLKSPETSTLLFNKNLVEQNLFSTTSFYKNQVNYTYRAKEKNLLTIDLVQFSNKNPQNFSVNGYDYSSIFNVAGANTFFQSSDNPVKYIGGQTRYYTNYKGATIILNAGYDRYDQKLLSSTSHNRYERADEKSYCNYLETFKDNLYGRADYYKRFSKNFQLTARLGVHSMSMQNNYKTSNVATATNRSFFLAPDISFRYFLKARSSFTLAYSYGNEFPDATKLHDSLVFSGYRTAARYQYSNKLQNEQRFSFGYRYNDSYNQFSAFVNSFVANTSNSYSNRTTVNSMFHLDDRYVVPTGNQLMGFLMGLSKFIPPLSSTLRLSGNAINNQFINNINQMSDRLVKNWTIGGRISLISGFRGFFNFSANWEYNAIKNSIQSSSFKFNNNSYINKAFLQTDYRIVKKHYLQISANRLQWIMGNEIQKPVIFLDGAYTGTIFKDKITISATLQNLLNMKSIAFNQVSDYSRGLIEYDLIPRVLLIGAKFKF